jgi:PAS domain S-box-containing protein
MKKTDKTSPGSELTSATIAEEKALSDALFLNIGHGAIATDSHGRISRVNQAALNLLGFKKEELIGRWLPGIIVATNEEGEVIPTMERAITQSFITGSAVSARCFYRKKDGSLAAIASNVSPIILDGRPVGAIEVFRDIAEELEVDRMKSEFISIASHQLRTPATAVKNYIAMLKDGFGGKLTKKQRQFAKRAYDSNERQLDIINDLLFVATTEARSLILKKEKTDLRQLIHEVALQQQKTIQGQDQELKIDLPNEPILHEVDPSYFKMVIDNLLSNASKYTPTGGEITIKLREFKKSIRLTVSDTGVGIEEADFKKLFKKFTRIDNRLSSAAGGSGIGLYLLKQIVELHDGNVSLKSDYGKGTTFTVTLAKN